MNPDWLNNTTLPRPATTSVDYLKETYTLDDFMSCRKTRNILEFERYNTYCGACEKDILDFYSHQCRCAYESVSSILFHDTAATKAGILSSIVYDNIEPVYDLEVFSAQPSLAAPLRLERERVKAQKEAERKRVLREAAAAAKSSKKNFDWITRKYID